MPSLYWHFANRDALLEGMADALMEPVAASNPEGEVWDARLGRVASEVPLVNDVTLAIEAIDVARDLFGAANVRVSSKPVTASEDFAQFLTRVPGCFVFLGNGERSAQLHNSNYDFNDEGLVHGLRFHAGIVRRRLAMLNRAETSLDAAGI